MLILKRNLIFFMEASAHGLPLEGAALVTSEEPFRSTRVKTVSLRGETAHQLTFMFMVNNLI